MQRLINTDPGFYELLGPVFGSREIDRAVKDRLFDDAGKVWLVEEKDGAVSAVVSLLRGVIKNVYAKGPDDLIPLLREIYAETSNGTLPACYQEQYMAAGYEIVKASVNFVMVKGGMSGD